jgi:hypothetical protein
MTTSIFCRFLTGTVPDSSLGLRLILGLISLSKLNCLFISASLCVPSLCRMDPNSSCMLAMCVEASVKITNDGSHEFCKACSILCCWS